jgi:hypothetical protein
MAVWYRFSSTRLVVLAVERCWRLARDAQEQFFCGDFQAVLRLPGNGLGLQRAGEGTDMLDWIPVCQEFVCQEFVCQEFVCQEFVCQELERLTAGFVWCDSIHPANRTD